MEEIIRLNEVSKLFSAYQAVDRVSLNVHRGETCVLIGSSGCGKTTTLKMINRLIEPSGGTIIIRGSEIRSLDTVDLRRSIGYVIQQIGLFPHMTIENNITIVLRLLGWDIKRRRKRAEELSELVGLPPQSFLNRYPRQLSGGEQQRVGVARALAADPDIILMDEPFGALDPITRKQLQKELKRIQSEVRKTIVFVTHDLPEAFFLGDHIVVMQAGRVLQDSSPRDLLLSPANHFVANFIGESRHFRSLQYLTVGELIAHQENAKFDGSQSPFFVFAEDSVLEAIKRLSSQSAGHIRPNAKEDIRVLNSSNQDVGNIGCEVFVKILGEALPSEV